MITNIVFRLCVTNDLGDSFSSLPPSTLACLRICFGFTVSDVFRLDWQALAYTDEFFWFEFASLITQTFGHIGFSFSQIWQRFCCCWFYRLFHLCVTILVSPLNSDGGQWLYFCFSSTCNVLIYSEEKSSSLVCNPSLGLSVFRLKSHFDLFRFFFCLKCGPC